MHTPSFTHITHFATSRLSWVRLNRILAWLMLVTPFAGIGLQMTFSHWWQIQFALLLAHGALSLLLFGLPRLKQRKFVFSMHVMGFRPRELGPRHKFLLNGLRIVLGQIAMFLLTSGLSLQAGMFNLLALFLLYPLLRLPFSTLQHVQQAAAYALQRWRIQGLSGANAAYLYYVLLCVFAILLNFNF